MVVHENHNGTFTTQDGSTFTNKWEAYAHDYNPNPGTLKSDGAECNNCSCANAGFLTLFFCIIMLAMNHSESQQEFWLPPTLAGGIIFYWFGLLPFMMDIGCAP